METNTFVFGMLTTTAVLILIASVVGVVKIHFLIKRVARIEEQTKHNNAMFERKVEDTYRDLDGRLDRLYVDNRNYIDNVVRELDTTKEKFAHELNEVQKHDLSYIDSRLDKLETKILSGTLESSKKQFLKG